MASRISPRISPAPCRTETEKGQLSAGAGTKISLNCGRFVVWCCAGAYVIVAVAVVGPDVIQDPLVGVRQHCLKKFS
jgi:hypothetical protein